MRRLIVPDYRRPQALMVPHYDSTILSLLETVAEKASRRVGVVLLSRHPQLTAAFVAAQPNPAHFRIVTADYDTPWLRDRSPVAVRYGRSIDWVLPQMETDERPLDEVLFQSISGRPMEHLIGGLPHGNLVAGPAGSAMVMVRDGDDQASIEEGLAGIGDALGVRRWIVAPAFAREMTGHADVHARFLNPRLAAVARDPRAGEDRDRADALSARIREQLPDIELLELPLRSEGGHYASPLNWLQFGRHLLVPRYPITPAEDVAHTAKALDRNGYRCEFVYSPTLEFGGSLHCLTASLFV